MIMDVKVLNDSYKESSFIDRYTGPTKWKVKKFGSLTHFSPISHFYTPLKNQKTIGFRDIFKGYRNVTLD